MVRVEVLTAPGCRKCEAAKALVVNTIARLRQEIPDLQGEVIKLGDDAEGGGERSEATKGRLHPGLDEEVSLVNPHDDQD